MYNKIGLEEHFAIPETMGGSTVYFEKTGAKDIRSTRLLDLEEMRLEQMDEYGMDMMIMSLNSPAIQEITDVQQAATIARKSNEDLAAAIERHPDRFRGFAALPLQDPDMAIEELHYEVNEVARGLKTNATKTIGVVIPELNNTFCAEIITGMEDVLRSHGYATIVCDCRTDKKLERDAVEFLSRKRVDGIISMPVDAEGNHLKKFQKTGKPIVLIDRRIQELSCDSVLVDNEKAAEDAMRVFF